MTQLASRLMVSKQQLTKIVDVLVEKNLVYRLSDENNRRHVLLDLTESGTQAVDTLQRLQAEKAADLFSDISYEEHRQLMCGLRLLEQVLHQKFGSTNASLSAGTLSDFLVGNTPSKG